MGTNRENPERMIVPVRIAIALYDRFRQLIHELAKFGVIGALGFVITWGGTNLLHFVVGMGPLTSIVIATAVAATFAYAGNRYWTFRNRADSGLGREYFLFFVLNAVGILIQVLCVGFTEYTLKMDDHFSYNVALIVGIGLGTMFRYWSYKKWVFLPPQLPAVDARTGLPSPDEVTAPDSLKGFAGGRRPTQVNGSTDMAFRPGGSDDRPAQSAARSPARRESRPQ
ncbi:MAG: GtrA family protein [Micromonosporaceae bacterium]